MFNVKFIFISNFILIICSEANVLITERYKIDRIFKCQKMLKYAKTKFFDIH